MATFTCCEKGGIREDNSSKLLFLSGINIEILELSSTLGSLYSGEISSEEEINTTRAGFYGTRPQLSEINTPSIATIGTQPTEVNENNLTTAIFGQPSYPQIQEENEVKISLILSSSDPILEKNDTEEVDLVAFWIQAEDGNETLNKLNLPSSFLEEENGSILAIQMTAEIEEKNYSAIPSSNPIGLFTSLIESNSITGSVSGYNATATDVSVTSGELASLYSQILESHESLASVERKETGSIEEENGSVIELGTTEDTMVVEETNNTDLILGKIEASSRDRCPIGAPNPTTVIYSYKVRTIRVTE